MDGINIIRLLGKLGELLGRLQAAVDMEQWEDAVLIGSALELTLSEFRSTIEKALEYCEAKYKEAVK